MLLQDEDTDLGCNYYRAYHRWEAEYDLLALEVEPTFFADDLNQEVPVLK